MKIELATIICSKQEIPWLDFGLESILEHTKHDINTTLYLARYTDPIQQHVYHQQIGLLHL